MISVRVAIAPETTGARVASRAAPTTTATVIAVTVTTTSPAAHRTGQARRTRQATAVVAKVKVARTVGITARIPRVATRIATVRSAMPKTRKTIASHKTARRRQPRTSKVAMTSVASSVINAVALVTL